MREAQQSRVTMEKEDIRRYFENMFQEKPDVSAAITAIQTLIKVLEHDKAETLQELIQNLKQATEVMKDTDISVTSVSSGCELFMRFITLASDSLEQEDFQLCKNIMLKRGELFLAKLGKARGKIARLGVPFIHDGAKILTHSMSRVVLQTLKEAAAANKRFEVYVTVSAPNSSGEEMVRELEQADISCRVVLDGAVGYVLESMDLVLVGAEGVVESGGIVNKIGSYTLALCAKALRKPLYVLVESFKFVRLYPLHQDDLPPHFKFPASKLKSDLEKEHPLVDYTPPSYITLLLTDLGILTPSAVSDELIKLYL